MFQIEEEKKAAKFFPVERDISKSYSFHVQRESQAQMKLDSLIGFNKPSNLQTKNLPKLGIIFLSSNYIEWRRHERN